MTKTGFAAINTQNTTGTAIVQDSLDLDNSISAGRVISIILDDTHPRYTELGGPKAIGAVEIVEISKNSTDYSSTLKSQIYNVAYPLIPGLKTYPLINEVVYIINQPSKDIQTETSSTTLYYTTVINLWNHPHHNAIPYSAGSSISQNLKNYQDSSTGSSNKLTNSSGTIKFGEYFKERSNINPLKPFEGDYTLEGRFGNSLRLGSTGGKNPWSSTGDQGNPIIILRNGQGVKLENGWNLVTEEVNQDLSSIYLTSNQKISLNPSSTNSYLSYENKPQAGNTYTNNQIILTSGRLFLNSTSDHTLISSAKTINLNAIDGVHIDTTGTTVLQSGTVLLGSKSADEPLILGDIAVTQLQEMLDILKELLVAASTAANGGGPVASLNSKAVELLTRANLINLNQIKSNRSFTI